MSVSAIKRSLSLELKRRNLDASVGISVGDDGDPCFAVYLKSIDSASVASLVPSIWYGIPVNTLTRTVGASQGVSR